MEGLLAGIRAAPARAGSTRVIALDGRSGAGKSTLAQALAGRLNAPLVSLEHLYGGWDGLDEGIARLHSTVLLPLAGGRAASVPRYDWHTLAWGEPWTLAPPELLIVEGVGAGSLSAAPYTSMLVWLEADAATRRERAGRRRSGDADEWERWERQEDAYIEREHPRERANVVIAS